MGGILFDKVKIANKELKNRITMTPMFMAYANKDGSVSNANIDHYRDMGSSGASMVVVENLIVDGERSWFGRLLRIDNDSMIPGLTKLAGGIKSGGALAFCQINHGGRFAAIANPMAPSPIPAFDGPVPEEMSVDQIKTVIDKYVAAAQRAQKAGFDGIELHGATGYLPAQFLSPRTNKRNDQYGGSLENRMRFGLELVNAIQDAVGTGYPVGYRFMADEWLPDGLQIEESKIYARELAKQGVAYLSVTAGTYESMFLEEKFKLASKENYMADLSKAIKNEVNVPVIVAGRITTPSVAEEVIDSGQADLVGLARVLVADPKWPQKAAQGKENEILQCKNCGTCMNLVMKQKQVICAGWDDVRKKKFKELLEG